MWNRRYRGGIAHKSRSRCAMDPPRRRIFSWHGGQPSPKLTRRLVDQPVNEGVDYSMARHQIYAHASTTFWESSSGRTPSWTNFFPPLREDETRPCARNRGFRFVSHVCLRIFLFRLAVAIALPLFVLLNRSKRLLPDRFAPGRGQDTSSLLRTFASISLWIFREAILNGERRHLYSELVVEMQWLF